MTANDRLAEIQARAEKATDGPWRHSVERERYETAHYVRHGEGEHLAVFTGNYSGASEDGEFIAHARTDVPALVAALRAVLHLHRPTMHQCGCCGTCDECDWEWPCGTVRAVEAALGEVAP